jgi:nucleolar protein 14
MARKKGLTHHTKKNAEKKDNPFEKRVERKKKAVLDPRARKKEVNLAEVRGRAEELRKQTLLIEYGQDNKANAFIDRRFGEDDASIPEEDKMLMRFQKEKQRQLRKGRNDFSLDDDEDLTHFGQSIGDNAMLHDISGEDNSGDEEFNVEMGKQLNFGGGKEEFRTGDDAEGESDERVKTKKEVMEEIIKKSKFHKAERKKEKAENENMIDELDNDFKEIQGMLKSRFDSPDKDDEKKEPDQVAKSIHSGAVEYNKLKNILGDDLRARATDRLKTEEEVAREEKQRLDKLEAARLKRMKGEELDAGAAFEAPKFGSKQALQAIRDKTGDQLDSEDEVIAEEEVTLVQYDRQGVLINTDGVASESDDGADSDDDADSEDGGDEVGDTKTGITPASGDTGIKRSTRVKVGGSATRRRGTDVSDNSKTTATRVTSTGNRSRTSAAAAPAEDESALPFVFDCPMNVDDYDFIVKGRSAALQTVIIKRIRACHHISLAAENRSKLQKFFALLWKLIGETIREKSDNSVSLPLVDVFSTHIIEMAEAMPEFAGALAMKYLQAISNGHRQSRENETYAWPPSESLFYLQLCAVIFPPSDLVHPILTPASLLVAQLLAQCQVIDISDISKGLFLCSWCVRTNKEQKRLQPEALAFCTALVALGVPEPSLSADNTKPGEQRKNTRSFAKRVGAEMNENMGLGTTGTAVDHKKIVRELLSLDGSDELETAPPLSLAFLWRGPSDFNTETTQQKVRVQCLTHAYKLLLQIVSDLNGNDACPEVLSALAEVLQSRAASPLPKMLRTQHDAVMQKCAKMIDSCRSNRRPLAYLKRRPVPLKAMNPKFEDEESKYKRSGDMKPVDEKLEHRKLVRSVYCHRFHLLLMRPRRALTDISPACSNANTRKRCAGRRRSSAKIARHWLAGGSRTGRRCGPATIARRTRL